MNWLHELFAATIIFAMGHACGWLMGRAFTNPRHGKNFHKAKDCQRGDGKCFAEVYHRDYERKDRP